MFVTSQLTIVLDFYLNFLCYFHLRCVIKSPSVIRCDKLGNYKSSESKSTLTYPKPEAQETLTKGMYKI
jgi:hypothetical protein